MNKGILSTVAAVLLILTALFNIGAGIAQYGMAELLQGATNLVSELGEGVADLNKKNSFDSRNSDLKASSNELRQAGTFMSLKLYVIAFLILTTAVIQIVASVGIFKLAPWAFKLTLSATALGILVEVQDIVEDGFGAGQGLFILAYGFILYVVLSSRQVHQSISKLPTDQTEVNHDPESINTTILQQDSIANSSGKSTPLRSDNTLTDLDSTRSIYENSRPSLHNKSTVIYMVAVGLLLLLGTSAYYIFLQNEEKNRQIAEARTQQRIAEENNKRTAATLRAMTQASRSPVQKASKESSKTTLEFNDFVGSWRNDNFCMTISNGLTKDDFQVRVWHCTQVEDRNAIRFTPRLLGRAVQLVDATGSQILELRGSEIIDGEFEVPSYSGDGYLERLWRGTEAPSDWKSRPGRDLPGPVVSKR